MASAWTTAMAQKQNRRTGKNQFSMGNKLCLVTPPSPHTNKNKNKNTHTDTHKHQYRDTRTHTHTHTHTPPHPLDSFQQECVVMSAGCSSYANDSLASQSPSYSAQWGWSSLHSSHTLCLSHSLSS